MNIIKCIFIFLHCYLLPAITYAQVLGKLNNHNVLERIPKGTYRESLKIDTEKYGNLYEYAKFIEKQLNDAGYNQLGWYLTSQEDKDRGSVATGFAVVTQPEKIDQNGISSSDRDNIECDINTNTNLIEFFNKLIATPTKGAYGKFRILLIYASNGSISNVIQSDTMSISNTMFKYGETSNGYMDYLKSMKTNKRISNLHIYELDCDPINQKIYFIKDSKIERDKHLKGTKLKLSN